MQFDALCISACSPLVGNTFLWARKVVLFPFAVVQFIGGTAATIGQRPVQSKKNKKIVFVYIILFFQEFFFGASRPIGVVVYIAFKLKSQ